MNTLSTINFIWALITSINWLWYSLSVIIVFVTGAAWFSFIFAKQWKKIFKVEIPENIDATNITATMLLQFIATASTGLIIFILASISGWLALFVLSAFCIWQKAGLKFKYYKYDDFVDAAMIETGYLFLSGLIFILFSFIS